MGAIVPVIHGLLVVLTLAPALADWAVPEATARLPLSIDGDLYAREQVHSQVVRDFNALLGAHRTLAADSLSLVDADSGETVALELAQHGEVRYASGNPILRMSWTSGPLGRFARRSWHLYLRAVPPGDEEAWAPLADTFVPSPEGVLIDTSFEQLHPDHDDRPLEMYPGGWDKEGETSERVWATGDARTGERALKIARRFDGEPPSNTNRPHWRMWPPRLPVLPGQTVRVTGWLKAAELGDNSLPTMTVEFYGPEEQRLQDGRKIMRGPRVASDEWVKVTATTTAPADAANAVVWFSLINEGVAYCDDVRVTVGPGAELPELPVAVGALEERAAFDAGEQARPEGKVLRCGIAEQPPTLDGTLDEPCWGDEGRIDDFAAHMQVPGTSVTTTVLACADRDALYFGFECTEPSTENLIARAAERDGRLWEDDSVELFLDTNRDLHTYYQIIVNSRGAIFDQDKGGPDLAGPQWDGPVTAAARVLPDRWIAEARLGFNGLRLAEAEGRVWGANFARSSFRDGRSLYVWSPVESNFGEPARFGRLVLPFDPSANVVTGRVLTGREAFCGEGTLSFQVNNRRGEPVAVRVTATEVTDEEESQLGEAASTVEPRSAAELGIPCALAGVGEVRVRYDLVEAATGELLYTTSVTHMVPQPLAIEPGALMVYLDEARVDGNWRLGVAQNALADSRLLLDVLPAEGEAPVASTEVTPDAQTGTYALSIADLRAGRYELRARLLQAGAPLSETSYRFECIPGPFAEDR